jgi:hypothetical protein
MSLELAQVEVTPEGATALEMRRELGAEESRPGIWERGAAKGLREQWISRVGEYMEVESDYEQGGLIYSLITAIGRGLQGANIKRLPERKDGKKIATW